MSNNPYRLQSTAFERESDTDKIAPKKIYFLSVEGNKTEKEYFKGISAHRDDLNINALVNVEILCRSSKDTNSAPKYVIELLEEYVRLRSIEDKSLIEDLPSKFINSFGIDFIKKYLNNPKDKTISIQEKKSFLTELTKIGYDIKYRQYLQKYDNEGDSFGILIDRDMLNHSELNMQECITYCHEKNYNCYIANPCFEFWLLLHLSDVSTEYTPKELELIEKNEKISNSHTYVSFEVSKKAHHGKTNLKFSKNYLPQVNLAVERAKKFACNENDLIQHIGCNLGNLIEDMKNM